MKVATNRTLKALIDILESKTGDGVMEPGRAEAITEAIEKVRHALQTKDRSAMSKAVDLIGRLVLREFR